MPEIRRCFTVLSSEGRKFPVIEFASYRWERNAAGERCRVENDGRDLYTSGGYRVVPAAEPWTYYIPGLGVIATELVEPADAESTHADGRGDVETLHDVD
jgi:hypothetical protein